ncbi:unnamed protein product [Adineta steineri]|uniref:Uncharacterized protein n=1 Tax=Adineta steineri TaxID=433720 RepID=A0A815A879_9BILA|nr:unnamed protein product [Adineta steineri]CAF1253335.1 unnamed protein product [Adineta steineri]
MTHSVIRRSPSSASSTVADPSTVTVRIEGASTSDLNVQDVLTTSSSNDDDDDNNDLKSRRRKQTLTDRFNHHSSSSTRRRHTSAVGHHHHHHHHHKNSLHQKHLSRMSTDSNSMPVPFNRPTTAVSLPLKSSAYDNKWDIDSPETSVTSIPRRNPSCPSISPTLIRSKPSAQSPVSSSFTPQPAPPVFTTTSEFLRTDFRPQIRRDNKKRPQSLVGQTLAMGDPASPTVPLVALTDDILLGSIRALQNERQLCKLYIEYIIDASNMRPDELARKANVGARLPCHCGHTHSRCTLTLEFDQPFFTSSSSSSSSLDSNQLSNSKVRELSRTQLGQLFSAVNRFISRAQQEGKRVLIYGFELTPNSPLAVIAIQYLMLSNNQLTLTEAMHTVHRLFPILPKKQQQFPTMDKRFQDYLKQLDRKIMPIDFGTSHVSGDNVSSGSSVNEARQSPRDRSTGSLEVTTTSTTSITPWTAIPMPITNDNTNQSHQLFTARPAWDS